ncbi:related to NAD-dependent histone deacetylase [Cephalotrichum gorgonifer]|uniref:Related to NAD-dependent histone deacetylase n=1 Tax=Cephalotrichum gorgonifer TaxID=2041049 RepID=A0AAE8SXS2_9PEZI|nr:related to NAD-dependent histone deacetylase [Cephalotrichum gorgonifer]
MPVTPKARRSTRSRDTKKTIVATGPKAKRSSSKSKPNSNGNGARPTPGGTRKRKTAGDGTSREDREPELLTPSSETSQTTNDFYAHIEEASSASSRWDTDSMLGAMLEELTDETSDPLDPESCTPDEATHLRHMLRRLGPQDFCRVTVDEGRYTAKKLLTAFRVRPPPFLEGAPDEAYYSIISAAIERELSKRAKLTQYNSFADAIELIRRSKNIVVVTGAGISTSLGIPDFRSSGTGLYSKLEQSGLVSQPEDVFEITQFRDDPAIFYSVAKDIIAPMNRFTPTHAFIALLQEKGKLLTNYTQNIDNLEAVAGVRPDKLIQCHGSFATATCLECQYKADLDEIIHDVKVGNPPPCPACTKRIAGAQAPRKRKRRSGKNKKRRRTFPGDDSESESEFDVPVAGIMKPDITFYGEEVPDAFSTRLTEHDRDIVDLVIVIGTSLTVHPVSEIVRFLPPNVPQINISKTPINHMNFDIDLMGHCDVVVAELCRGLGWTFKHKMIPEGQVVQVTRTPGFVSRYDFTDATPA